MKKLASAAPVLFCLINLLYPVGIKAAEARGDELMLPYPFVWFCVITACSVFLSILWFCYSYDHSDIVRGYHCLLGMLAPTLSAITGLCFMLAAPGVWPCALSIVLWISSLAIPGCCRDYRFGKSVREFLTLAPGVCVLVCSLVLVLGHHFF